MSDPGFDLVAGAFQSSRLYGAWRALTEGFTSASNDSALLRPIRSFARAFAQQPAGRKLACAATTIGIAAIAHLTVRMTLPHYATSGLPWWWNVAEAVFAFGIAFQAEAVARAWIDSMPARIWRSLTT